MLWRDIAKWAKVSGPGTNLSARGLMPAQQRNNVVLTSQKSRKPCVWRSRQLLVCGVWMVRQRIGAAASVARLPRSTRDGDEHEVSRLHVRLASERYSALRDAMPVRSCALSACMRDGKSGMNELVRSLTGFRHGPTKYGLTELE